MSSDPIVEQVREAADIGQIIGEHVKLKRAGADLRGPCPFHGGKNPNFSVSPRRGQYHCFKCGESGDVFTFLQKHLGMSFPDALRSVAGTVGIEIPQRTERAGPDPRDPYWELNAAAAEFFKRSLWEDERGAAARAYLEKRDVTRADAERFELGFAPDDIGTFRNALGSLGFDVPRLVDGGLMTIRDENSEPRPRFRNRLIFPILDSAGRHTAFGGRALGNVEPKYLNSPETPVFSKSRTLYALNWTKNGIRKGDRAFIVEGFMDALRLLIAGIDAVVAPMGTALTELQAASLSRYSKNVYLLYDSDQAGLKATFRAGDELLRHGCAVRVVTLPEGEDPDTFVRAHGSAALEQYVAQSVDVFERKIQILERGGWFAELQKKRRALDRLLPTIRATSDPLLRELYVSRAAEKTGITKEILDREVISRAVPSPEPADEPNAPQRGLVHVRRTERRADRIGAAEAAERELVRAMLSDHSKTEVIAEKISPAQFRTHSLRAIFAALLNMEGEISFESLADRLDPEDVGELDTLLEARHAHIDPDETISASIAVIAMRDLDARLAEIDSIMSVATITEQMELMREKQKLQKEIEGLGQPAAKSFKFLKRRQAAPLE